MATHKMKRIKDAAGRVVFTGAISPGIGQHDYVCGRCGTPILTRVGVRSPSSAAYECTECGAFNVIAERGKASADTDRAPRHVCRHD